MNKKVDDSYLDYVQPDTSGGDLQLLQQLAEAQAQAELDIANITVQLTKAREIYKDLAEIQIPDVMDKIGIAEFKTTTGLKITIAETIRASIPKAKQPHAFHWLRTNGHSAMIKRTVSVSFGKGEDANADTLVKKLDNDFDVADKTVVHPQTLAAFVREKLEMGEELPMDLFGVHRQRLSKIGMDKK